MNNNIKNSSDYIIQLILIIIFLFSTAFLAIYTLKMFFWTIFFAIVLYVAFDKYNKILRKYIKNKHLSTIIIILFILFVVVAPVLTIVFILIQQIINLFLSIKSSIESGELLNFFLNFELMVNFFTTDPFFSITFLNYLGDVLKDYSDYLNIFNIGGLLGGVYNLFLFGLNFALRFVIYLAITFIILYFLLLEGSTLYLTLSNILPFDQKITEEFKTQMKLVLRAILKGNILIAILQGVSLSFSFFIAGIPDIVLYGFLASVFSVIPIVGTSPVWIPAALYLYFIKGSFGWAIFVSVYCFLSFLILENVVKPKFLDKQIGIHSIFLFLAIIGGLKEFGINGIIIGPLILALFLIVWRLYPKIQDLKKVNSISNLNDQDITKES